MTSICPECGSSKMELIEDEFTEIIKKGHADEIGRDIGINSHVKAGWSKTESENNEAGLYIPRKDRLVCHDCGTSFPKNNVPHTIINGYKVFMNDQFISDYFRETGKYDLKDLFVQIRINLGKFMKEVIKNNKTGSGKQQFSMRIVICKIRYSLTCEIDLKEMSGIVMEGLVRKR